MSVEPEKPTILVVDDDMGTLIAMEAVLKELDVNVLIESNADDGVYRVVTNTIALVILDVQMPGVDGYETASQIRETEQGRHVPIIFITGMTVGRNDVFKGYESGAIDYLLKPVDNDLLKAKVNAVLHLDSYKVESKKREDSLTLSNKQLRKFAAMVSHDLKAPLRQIQHYGALVIDELGFEDANDGAKEHVKYICDAASRLNLLVTTLLKYAQVDSAPAYFKENPLEDIVNTVLSDFQWASDKLGAKISLAGEWPVIECDETQITELFLNLISNALKYHREGVPPEIVITANSSSESNDCLVKVRDNGIGFKPEYKDRIFEPFRRLVHQSEYEGSGVGLAIVSKIIRVHNGKIDVETTPGEGTEFAVNLPLRQQ